MNEQQQTMHQAPQREPARRRRGIAVIAAVATVVAALGVTQVSAQTRVDTGNQADANPRVGSGGYNSQPRNPFDATLGNDIVYGNVTAGRQFRGPAVGDPRAFRGATTNTVDNFVRSSSGVTGGGVTSFNANNVTSYYGESRFVEPPSNFVQVPGVGGYVPQRTTVVRDTFDTRLGYVLPDPSVDNSALTPLDLNQLTRPTGQLGLRESEVLGETRVLSDYTVVGRGAAAIEEARLDRIRRELLGEDEVNPDALRNDIDSGALDRGATGEADRLNANTQDDALTANIGDEQPAALDNSLDASVDARQERGLRDTQYDALNRRLESRRTELGSRTVRPDGANEDEEGDDQSPIVPTGGNGETPTDDQATPQDPPVIPEADGDDAPPTVTDLGAGIQARGMQELFSDAQTALDEGRYSDASDLYATADRLDPSNSFGKLGRAVADLGGGYYRLAAQEFREAFGRDPALLMGNYDLGKLLGEERLVEITNNVKEMVNANEDDPSPAFLLAVIHYNNGDPRLAGSFLELAERRSNGDAFYGKVAEFWNVEGQNK